MSTIFIVSKTVNYSFKTIVFKGIAGLFFLALGIVCFCLNAEGHLFFKIFTILGLFFGLLGDIFLGFKNATKSKKLWTLAGLFAFALGHIFYTAGLFVDFYVAGNLLTFVLSFGSPLALILIYIFIARKVGIRFDKKILAFIIFYLYCLLSMLSTSICIGFLHNFSSPTLIMFAVGAACFVVSDMMLSGAYFKEGERPKWYNATYSVFYYIAQFIIAFSIFFLV